MQRIGNQEAGGCPILKYLALTVIVVGSSILLSFLSLLVTSRIEIVKSDVIKIVRKREE